MSIGGRARAGSAGIWVDLEGEQAARDITGDDPTDRVKIEEWVALIERLADRVR